MSWTSPSPLLHSSSQGYMGVLVGDVDSDAAAKLKLKEVRGAVITLIDHDAPAAQAGIRVNDVVLQVNGQPVEGAEQFSAHDARDSCRPAGEPADQPRRKHADHRACSWRTARRWSTMSGTGSTTAGDPAAAAPGMGILGGGGGDVPSGGFHMPFVGASTLNVGAMVEPLTSQMAEYLGVQSGLMIKQVARKSEAEKAGLKAFDVILKVGADGIATTADWDRALRANQGQAGAVTILRDRRQQTVTSQVDTKRHHAELEKSRRRVLSRLGGDGFFLEGYATHLDGLLIHSADGGWLRRFCIGLLMVTVAVWFGLVKAKPDQWSAAGISDPCRWAALEQLFGHCRRGG